jgi:hypothetical protein
MAFDGSAEYAARAGIVQLVPLSSTAPPPVPDELVLLLEVLLLEVPLLEAPLLEVPLLEAPPVEEEPLDPVAPPAPELVPAVVVLPLLVSVPAVVVLVAVAAPVPPAPVSSGAGASLEAQPTTATRAQEKPRVRAREGVDLVAARQDRCMWSSSGIGRRRRVSASGERAIRRFRTRLHP